MSLSGQDSKTSERHQITRARCQSAELRARAPVRQRAPEEFVFSWLHVKGCFSSEQAVLRPQRLQPTCLMPELKLRGRSTEDSHNGANLTQS